MSWIDIAMFGSVTVAGGCFVAAHWLRATQWREVDRDGPFIRQWSRETGEFRTVVPGYAMRKLHPDMKPKWEKQG